ncbi:MAG: prepilin-type N-terminal cleavage/methylation domain-containing protein [Candidatus Nitricoxidivorans perseverans]|uniref:Prepilin-type N-terminal cleavage/methylation domain-containing protein n=1 Tax=Candidatus Nitricoxidivorans perseverans TaxID=2975601 RepID=A0AA49FKP8_9PROT|nr:MAG: prepilin-type N-terminal cleavage/methylation domain-containing protein [Candidatus Nitricoxidivorans perseverans]
MHGLPPRIRGFTLVEAIVAITITGILAGIVAVFIKSPMDSFIDMRRRADLTDAADTAVRRIARDIHLALPNSVRNPADSDDQCVEFIPTKIGGRYRAAAEGGTGNGDLLDFTSVDAGFDMLWPNSALPAGVRPAAGDVVVVYNDGYLGNAYAGSNAIRIDSLAEPGGTANTTAIAFVDAVTGAPFNRKQLPAESPAWRFQVIPSAEHVVSYACGGGTLYRHSRTLSAAWAQPADCAAMTAGATSAILAQNVSQCSLKYDPPGSGTGLSRNGILSISIEITQSGESVRLYHQVHVDNTP